MRLATQIKVALFSYEHIAAAACVVGVGGPHGGRAGGTGLEYHQPSFYFYQSLLCRKVKMFCFVSYCVFWFRSFLKIGHV